MHDIVTNFEDLNDCVFDETIGVLHDAQYEFSALIKTPTEILKDSFETMASN
jgi:hypothetical protein